MKGFKFLNSRLSGHLSMAVAYIIYGVNLITTKDISNSDVIGPESLFYIRVSGACILFWIISLFFPTERLSKKDKLLMLPASILGLFFSQYFFLVGITMATPLETGIIMTLIPVFTMVFSYLFSKEKFTWLKLFGIIISLLGIIVLIFDSNKIDGVAYSGEDMKGMLYVLLSVIGFALYLGLFKNFIQRYKVITFNKWLFLYCAIFSIPFCFRPLIHTNFSVISSIVYWEIGYLVFFATFLVYFCFSFGQQRIEPTIASMYSYMQPIIAAILGVIVGMEVMEWEKLVAIILVFIGVYIVNRSK